MSESVNFKGSTTNLILSDPGGLETYIRVTLVG